MNLLSTAVGAAEDTQFPYIKDAVCRIVVEMIKREWPQQWPSLLAELSEACSKGETQTEVVLLIFLRLVEDVALLKVNLNFKCVKKKVIFFRLLNRTSEEKIFFMLLQLT